MKKLFAILTTVLVSATLWAQSPEKMSYQSVIRDSNDNLVTNQSVGMQISILQGSSTGTAVYTETQTPTTNDNGLVSLEIGAGTVVSGNFTDIDWANGSYFIETETDPTGGINYTIAGTSQLLSVPYALHANEVDPNVPQGTQAGEMQYWNGTAWIVVAAGNEGDIMTIINNTPTWFGSSSVVSVENPITGEIWMDRNLGASQVATSSTDAAAYGDLYQWGRGTDGHESPTSNTTSTLSSSDTPEHADFITNTTSPFDWRSPQNDNLWQGVSGINNPCPSGYRIPTYYEWEAERASWSSNNAAGAFASPLKLTLPGYRSGNDGLLDNVDTHACYWSSSVYGNQSQRLYFFSGWAMMGGGNRTFGYSVRCIKD